MTTSLEEKEYFGILCFLTLLSTVVFYAEQDGFVIGSSDVYETTTSPINTDGSVSLSASGGSPCFTGANDTLDTWDGGTECLRSRWWRSGITGKYCPGFSSRSVR